MSPDFCYLSPRPFTLGTHKQEKWTIQVLARRWHFLNERIIDVIVTPLEMSKASICYVSQIVADRIGFCA